MSLHSRQNSSNSVGSQQDSNITEWQWAWQFSSSTGTSWMAEQQRAQAWQQEAQKVCRQEEQASNRPRISTEHWHDKHANSICKQESVAERK